MTIPVSIEQARAWYSPDDPVHGFDHVLRVYYMAEDLARKEDADIEMVRAAVLLHDVQVEAGERQAHHEAAAAFAARVLQAQGWPQKRIAAVQHCIRAHRFRQPSESPQTIEAKVVFDADKLDAIGAVGAARAIAYSLAAGGPIFAPPSERFMQTGETEAGEPYSAYHEYLFKLRKIQDRIFTPSAAAIAAERSRLMAAFFDNLAREMSLPAAETQTGAENAG